VLQCCLVISWSYYRLVSDTILSCVCSARTLRRVCPARDVYCTAINYFQWCVVNVLNINPVKCVSCDLTWSYLGFTVNPRINAPGVYSYNRSEPPAFIRDPAFIKSCCIGLLRKNVCSWLQRQTDFSTRPIKLVHIVQSTASLPYSILYCRAINT